MVRPALVADVDALAALNVAAWRESYRHLLSQQFLAGVSVEARAAIWRQVLQVPGQVSVVAEQGGTLVGFAGARPSADGPRPTQLWGIYVLQSSHGTGVAQRLLDAAVGDALCFLWVAADNPRAHAFYRRNGFSPDGAEQSEADWEDMLLVRLVR